MPFEPTGSKENKKLRGNSLLVSKKVAGNANQLASNGLIVVVAAHYFRKVEGRVRFPFGPQYL